MHIVHIGPFAQVVQLGIIVHGTHVFVIDVLNTYPETQELHVGPSTQEEQDGKLQGKHDLLEFEKSR